MKGRFGSLSLLLAVALLVGAGSLQAQAQRKGFSHVRIVRLSFVDGTVLVKRPGVQEWAKASVNTPIEQGFSVSTSDHSFAEVEFENGSTARLGQLSQLDFTTLALDSKGNKINDLTFAQGYGTFHLIPRHGDVYAVEAANEVISPHGKAEFRTDLTQGRLRVQVFNGSVEVKDSKQSVKLTKDKTLETDPQTLTAFNISHGIQKDSWDSWVEKRDRQVEMAFNDSPVSANSTLYGWSDLDTYGEWGFFPGYGYGWAPFAPMGWTPFSVGQWSWYPGSGYTWISSEPWGWLPFHYGYWNYSPGFGYFWTPGNMSVWNPASVAWYRGAGYVGWAALGPNGAPVCSTAACINAVRAGTLQKGVPVDINTRIHVNQAELIHVPLPDARPSALAMLPGAPVSRSTVVSGAVAAAGTGAASPAKINVRNAQLQSAGAFTATHAAAPRVVLMGEAASPRAAQVQNAAHQSFFTRTFGGSATGPMHARLGNTLGGHYTAFTRIGSSSFQAVAAPGEARSESRINARFAGSSATHPVFLEHRSDTFSRPAARLEGGRIQAVNRGSIAPAGGFNAAPVSVGASAPASPSSGVSPAVYQGGGGAARSGNRAAPSGGRR
ncbi:MAG: DUF6600 domain-containing protein [Terriglobia bacterium]